MTTSCIPRCQAKKGSNEQKYHQQFYKESKCHGMEIIKKFIFGHTAEGQSRSKHANWTKLIPGVWGVLIVKSLALWVLDVLALKLKPIIYQLCDFRQVA